MPLSSDTCWYTSLLGSTPNLTGILKGRCLKNQNSDLYDSSEVSLISSGDIIHAQELLNALEQNPWKTYIEVLAENGKVAIDEINNHLDPELGIQKSVEITGIGGLGQTSVARE